jgi:hypothetical protein
VVLGDRPGEHVGDEVVAGDEARLAVFSGVTVQLVLRVERRGRRPGQGERARAGMLVEDEGPDETTASSATSSRRPIALAVDHEGPESVPDPSLVAAGNRSRRLVARADAATPTARLWRGGREIDDRHAGLPVSDVMNGHGDGGGRPCRARDGYP